MHSLAPIAGITDTYPQAPFTSPPSKTKFTVEVIFRMTPEDLARPAFDLDNFAKPVLDTLFTSQNVSGWPASCRASVYASPCMGSDPSRERARGARVRETQEDQIIIKSAKHRHRPPGRR